MNVLTLVRRDSAAVQAEQACQHGDSLEPACAALDYPPCQPSRSSRGLLRFPDATCFWGQQRLRKDVEAVVNDVSRFSLRIQADRYESA
ncbi:MAG: hypothetical protein C0522_09445 [Rhodocyclaceae bacterium]|nr:hypothetical protein [Rhodocyclaceae bacterium]